MDFTAAYDAGIGIGVLVAGTGVIVAGVELTVVIVAGADTTVVGAVGVTGVCADAVIGGGFAGGHLVVDAPSAGGGTGKA